VELQERSTDQMNEAISVDDDQFESAKERQNRLSMESLTLSEKSERHILQ
jgi:hypothetical protein